MSERERATTSRPTSGFRGLAARRPLTVFLGIVFGMGWPVLSVPLLADRGVVDGGPLPAELFALGVTWFVMLPAALWVTAVSDGPGAARALLRRVVRWRFGWWWAAILLALPATTLGVGFGLGGSLDLGGGSAQWVQGLVLLVTAVLLIHLWEETVWAGFLQTRLEGRHNLVIAALLTAVPFSAIHIPIIVIGRTDVLAAIGGVLVLGVAMRLLVGVFMRGTGGSVLAAGLVHGVYNACNNNGGLVDGLLRDADQNLAAPIALVVVTAAAAAVIHRRRRPALDDTEPSRRPQQHRSTSPFLRSDDDHRRPVPAPVPQDRPGPAPLLGAPAQPEPTQAHRRP
jgi:membrane protease YdiL (CAAX protease family)